MADIKEKWKTMASKAQAPFKDQAKKLAIVYKEHLRNEVPVQEIEAAQS